jgi:hypothetical protein
LFRFTLTAGNIADITAAHELAAKPPSNGCLIGDMGGYDAKKIRVDLAFRGTATVIPTNPTHKHQWCINRETYKDRNLIKRGSGCCHYLVG